MTLKKLIDYWNSIGRFQYWLMQTNIESAQVLSENFHSVQVNRNILMNEWKQVLIDY